MKNIRICSLFSGIGGFETGIFQAVGKEHADVVFASEIDPYARSAYETIYGHVPHGDITQIHAQDVPEHDILVGGFPCQAFSLSGKRLGFADTRGTLFFDIARIVKEKKPQFIFLENVKGLLSHEEGRTFHVILRTLSELGYAVDFNVLNSKRFGVPQSRERVFIVAKKTENTQTAWHIHKGNTLANKTKKELNEAEDIRKWNFAFPDVVDDTVRIEHVLEVYSDPKYTVSEGKKARLLSQLQEPYHVGDVFLIDDQGRLKKRLHKLAISPTIRREMHGNEPKIVTVKEHDVEMRRLTPLECFRLQGFPDSYMRTLQQAGMSDTQLYKMAGNAVTTNVIAAVFQVLMDEYIEGK